MLAVLERRTYCPRCGLPMPRSERLGIRFCSRCLTGYRGGLRVPLERVSLALAALVQPSSAAPPNRQRFKRPLAPPEASCAMGPKDCQGPVQVHHLVPFERSPWHPLIHHPDNLVCLCRRHHRLLHLRWTGKDFAGEPRREKVPPGGYGALSLGYARWALANIRPSHQLKALRLGMLLWGRLENREDLSVTQPTPVSLYCRWLDTILGDGGEKRVFRGQVYQYEEDAYDPPSAKGMSGTCRTYLVYPDVVDRLKMGPHLEVDLRDLPAILATLLEESGRSRVYLREHLRTERRTKPSPATLSMWIKRGKMLIEQVGPI